MKEGLRQPQAVPPPELIQQKEGGGGNQRMSETPNAHYGGV